MVACPEHVILKKMEYYKEGRHEKHLRDITGILKIQGDKIDREYLDLLAIRHGVHDIWQSILQRLDQPPG